MKIKKAKILVVEDEDSIRSFIKLNLEMADFRVIEARTGEEALDLIEKIAPNVIVLDIMLPGIDGLEVCEKIREKLPNSFIIMLTAKSQDDDKIAGLELGADDYMIKPFNPLELIARIKAMLRRGEKIERDEFLYSFAGLKLNVDSSRLFKNGKEVVLTPIEYYLLKLLMENQGKTLKRDVILNKVWGYDYFGDTKTLDVHIRRLREKIEENPSGPKFIKTVWGLGYRWQNIVDGDQR